MDDKNEQLPWDYFLTNYEKDLLQLPIEETLRKYPRVSREQIVSDMTEIQETMEIPQ
jgi:hypothetical protein